MAQFPVHFFPIQTLPFKQCELLQLLLKQAHDINTYLPCYNSFSLFQVDKKEGIEGPSYQLSNIRRKKSDSAVTPYGEPLDLETDYDWWKGLDPSSQSDAPKFSVKQQNDGGILIEPGQLSGKE